MDRRDEATTVPVGRLDGRGERRRAAAVIGVIAAVVVVGLASAQLRPEVTPPVAVVPVETIAPITEAPPSPPASVEVTPPRLRAVELVEAVLSGSLDHAMVYADATLDVECGDARRPCDDPTLAVEGLALDVVPGTFGARVGIPLPRSVLVLEVQGTGLVYRGALIVQSNGTPRYEVLAGGSAARPPDPPPSPTSRAGSCSTGHARPRRARSCPVPGSRCWPTRSRRRPATGAPTPGLRSPSRSAPGGSTTRARPSSRARSSSDPTRVPRTDDAPGLGDRRPLRPVALGARRDPVTGPRAYDRAR